VAGALAAGTGGGEAQGAVETVAAKEAWAASRAWCLSGNRLVKATGPGPFATTTTARQVWRPGSIAEVVEVVKSLPPTTPIACVCGGHESSNAAIVAASDAVVLDLARLQAIEFATDSGGTLVTVGAGVVFRQLVEAVKAKGGALPVGTGPDVGVVGYVVNGGLSGYFSRRLGLLGQRVESLTVVTAAGEVRVVKAGSELFTALLGAGSALGIVCDVTIRVADGSILRSAEQRVVGFQSRAQAVAFARDALRILRDRVLPTDAVSMELVVTGAKAVVVTVVFYDSFRGDPADFVRPLEELAARLELPIVARATWTTWYEAAAALWPVLAEIKGSPLGMLQHCMGTEGAPDDVILDFIADTVVAEAPLDEAPFSIIEIRTLGGAVIEKTPLPTGNCRHRFFVDVITLYDAKGKTVEEREKIADLTARVVTKARGVRGLAVDFSGTHSQPDDPRQAVEANVIFGTETLADVVRRQKTAFDPADRFRFHPFARLRLG
jgi:FAD/FMN-containing dehydrogenase